MQQIKDMKISEIHPYERNPRKNDDAVDAVANSIRDFGWKQPIVVDKDMTIIVGHTRYKAAKKLKLKTVPVLVADDLTEEQVKAYRIADNSTNGLAMWDYDLLMPEIKGLDYDFADFGLDLMNTEEVELKATNENRDSEEIDISEFDDDNFDCECPRCHFRFNRQGGQ